MAHVLKVVALNYHIKKKTPPFFYRNQMMIKKINLIKGSIAISSVLTFT
jgi:hypothetical protein